MHRTATRRRTLGRFHCGLCGVAIGVLVGLVAISAQPPGSSSTVVTHMLTVSRFSGVDDFTDDDAREIIAHMTHILRTDDDGTGPNDVGCDVNFTLAGAVETFDDGHGVVAIEQDFWEIIDLPGDVKVVADVSWVQGYDRQYWRMLGRKLLCGEDGLGSGHRRIPVGSRVRACQGLGTPTRSRAEDGHECDCQRWKSAS